MKAERFFQATAACALILISTGMAKADEKKTEHETINAYAPWEGRGHIYPTGKNQATFVGSFTGVLYVEREGQKGIVIGKGGLMLKRIGTSARKEIEKVADAKVNLRLWVKVAPEWKKKIAFLKEMGYPVDRNNK